MQQGPRLTDEQAAAVNCRGVSVALSAGAGCGKTSVLTHRFLSHLEPERDRERLHRLVAITFTDFAAREMRHRIREACTARLLDPHQPVAYWLQVFRGLDSARISTIHSFCSGLLRAHAVEAGIDPRFTLLEPALADTLLQSSATEVLHEALIEDDPHAAAFVLRFGLNRACDIAAKLAGQRFRIDWRAWQSMTADQLAARWQHVWQNEFVPKLVAQVRNSAAAKALARLLHEETPSHPEMLRRWTALRNWFEPDCDWPEPVDKTLNTIHDLAKVQGGGSKKAWRSEDVYATVREACAEFRNAIHGVVKDLIDPAADIEFAAEFALHGVKLAQRVSERYENAKRDAGALDFDDLLLRARNLLRDNSDVCRRFSEGISLLLVDEFQDTDPVQADLVRALCGEALKAGRLFLVGDINQSIYRFRRADPNVFRELKREIGAAGQMALTLNFRSQPAILNFVNLLFCDALPNYERLQPSAAQLSPQPCIEFLWATEPAEDAAVDKPSARQLRTWEAEWIARRIVELLNDETPRIRTTDRAQNTTVLRRVEPGDIAILFRALTDVAVYEEALRDYNVPYYLVGGKAFFAQQEIYDILNLCRCLDDPSDSLALAGVLRSPFFGLSDDALHALRPDDGDWWTRLQQPPPAMLPDFQQNQLRFAARVLSELRRQKDERSIAELLHAAVAATGYDAALLAEHLGDRKVANLRKLIDRASVFDSCDLYTLKDFVQWLQSSVFEQTDEEFATTLPQTGDVVRLMSVHKAKGLEFPVVILADINRESRKSVDGVALHPEWGALFSLPKDFGRDRRHLGRKMLQIEETQADREEALRLFYVATTRAKDHLILSAGIGPDLKPDSPWLALLAERFSLQSGNPAGDALLGAMAGARSRAEIPDIKVHRKIPAARKPKLERERRRLDRFDEALLSAEPRPLPPSATIYSPDALAPRVISVSALEQAAARLFPELAAGHGSSETAAAAEALGTLIHAVMERVDPAAEDWSPVFHAAVRALPKPLDNEQLQLADQLVRNLQRSDLARQLREAQQVWREFDILLAWPSQHPDREADLITGQVDCCFVTPNGTMHLVDYKTGDYSQARSDEAILSPYRLQLGLYALAAEQWWGRPLDSVELVICRPHVRRIAFHFDAAARQQLDEWINQALREIRVHPAPP